MAASWSEALKCPNCGCDKAQLRDIRPLFDDVRFDELKCSDCGTVWRVYYKVTDIRAEVMSLPATTADVESCDQDVVSE